MASSKVHRAAASTAERPALASRLWMGVAMALLLLGLGLMGLWLAGFQLIALRGHSMEPTFSPGALLIARSTPPDRVQVGDVIVFSGGVTGQPDIVHRVVKLHENRSVVTTMGDKQPHPGPRPCSLERPGAPHNVVNTHRRLVDYARGWQVSAHGQLDTDRARRAPPGGPARR